MPSFSERPIETLRAKVEDTPRSDRDPSSFAAPYDAGGSDSKSCQAEKGGPESHCQDWRCCCAANSRIQVIGRRERIDNFQEKEEEGRRGSRGAESCERRPSLAEVINDHIRPGCRLSL